MKLANQANVFAICDELNRNGKKPTLPLVREALGGGSFTTIQPLVKEWKQARSHAEVAPVAAIAPEDIADLGKSLVAQIWHKAEQKAAEELRGIRTDYDKRLDDLDQEKKEALQEVQRLEEEAGSAALEFKNLRVEFESYRTDMDRNLVDLNVRLGIQRERLEEADELKSRYEKLLMEHGEVRGRLDELKKKKDS